MSEAPLPPGQTAAAAGASAAARPVKLPETTEGFPWVSNHEVKKESNPFTERDWRMLGYAWSGFVLRVILVFGAIFSVYQFMVARDEKRVERTLALAELWEKQEYQDAQRSLRTRLEALNTRYQQDLGADPSPQQRAYFQERLGMIAMTPEGGDTPLPKFREDFDRTVYLLNRVASCVETDLCSTSVADAYFRDYADSFWAYFAGFIMAERKSRSPTLAAPIEQYVRRGQEPPASTN
ncbi:DUF4760 domain-containing protein [Mesorhizobium sp. ASY16-5R]|uniref:DUF4760 domain-containing protein n=1 Tax=Mesorhizobium sp. ASY16-5R TaxID=3445772 RepID=UPI003F9F95F7